MERSIVEEFAVHEGGAYTAEENGNRGLECLATIAEQDEMVNVKLRECALDGANCISRRLFRKNQQSQL